MDFQLKYVGPKPLWSCRGVSFDTRKQDKFLYISSVAELIAAIDHDYEISNPYVAQTGQTALDEQTIIKLIRKHMPEFDQYIGYWIKKTRDEIDQDIERARCCAVLNQIEQLSIINNLYLLQDYRIQRTINKSVYYAGIQVLANLFKENGLQYIIAPIAGQFFHVLHSLQGPLRVFHPLIDTSLEIYLEKNRLMAALKRI